MDYARRSLEQGSRASADTISRRAAAPLDRRAEAVALGPLIQAMRSGPALQLKGGAEEEDLQMKRAPGVTQRAALEEEPLQGRFSTAQREAEPSAGRNETGLPDTLKAGVESLSGLSMDGVKVHYNSAQPAQLNALAYAQGADIHLAPGQERHLPHEAWHVVQQAQGRVQPTMQMRDSTPVNDDAALESEADVMGARAASLDTTAQS